MSELDDNFLDSLLRGKAIVLASRIHDKQRIAQALQDHIDREREKRFMQQTMDDHLREIEEGLPQITRIEFRSVPKDFSYEAYAQKVWQQAARHFAQLYLSKLVPPTDP